MVDRLIWTVLFFTTCIPSSLFTPTEAAIWHNRCQRTKVAAAGSKLIDECQTIPPLKRKLAFVPQLLPTSLPFLSNNNVVAASAAAAAADSCSWMTTMTTTDANVIMWWLWGLRLASAAAGYVGCVAYLDRPRGGTLPQQQLQLPSVEVRPSTVEGAGLGLFATESLPRGTTLGVYPGVLLPPLQNLNKLQQYPHCEAYIWRFSDSKFVLDPTDEYGNLQEVCRGGTSTWPLSIMICRALTRPVPTPLCRVNEPPRGRDVNVVTEEDLTQRTVMFVLERDVYAGEELFMDYGLTYDRSGYMPPGATPPGTTKQ